jgi:hypothetical protein
MKSRESRSKELVRTYGITVEEYEFLAVLQEDRCAICGSIDPARQLSVDHDHQTGKVRGLLCGNCNVGIGMFQDDPYRLDAAAAYLRRE